MISIQTRDVSSERERILAGREGNLLHKNEETIKSVMKIRKRKKLCNTSYIALKVEILGQLVAIL